MQTSSSIAEMYPTPSSPKILSFDLKKQKRRRMRTSRGQKEALMKVFELYPMPSTKLRQDLGDQIGMTPRAVQVWFQNRRQILKKGTQSPSPKTDHVDSPTSESQTYRDSSPGLQPSNCADIAAVALLGLTGAFPSPKQGSLYS
jgi:hypothetical protein